MFKVLDETVKGGAYVDQCGNDGQPLGFCDMTKNDGEMYLIARFRGRCFCVCEEADEFPVIIPFESFGDV